MASSIGLSQMHPSLTPHRKSPPRVAQPQQRPASTSGQVSSMRTAFGFLTVSEMASSSDSDAELCGDKKAAWHNKFVLKHLHMKHSQLPGQASNRSVQRAHGCKWHCKELRPVLSIRRLLGPSVFAAKLSGNQTSRLKRLGMWMRKALYGPHNWSIERVCLQLSFR